jgi:hypothetical protein
VGDPGRFHGPTAHTSKISRVAIIESEITNIDLFLVYYVVVVVKIDFGRMRGGGGCLVHTSDHRDEWSMLAFRIGLCYTKTLSNRVLIANLTNTVDGSGDFAVICMNDSIFHLVGELFRS